MPVHPPKNHDVRMISLGECDVKGKAKVVEVEAMPVKKSRRAERMEPTPEEVENMEEEAESSKASKARSRKRKARSRRRIELDDFSLGKGTRAYDLLADVRAQGPKISWPQLLHLSPTVRRQWSKMVSTRPMRDRHVNAIKARKTKDIVPLVEAQINGQRISKAYVDGGAEICVMAEKLMHRLGLEVSETTKFGAKMANNVVVNCFGVIKKVKVEVCGVQLELDMYVMLVKGEGYPLILGWPWLMGMKARQDWDTGALELRPQKGLQKNGRALSTT